MSNGMVPDGYEKGTRLVLERVLEKMYQVGIRMAPETAIVVY